MKILLIGGTGVLSRDISKRAMSQGMELFLLNRGNRPGEIPPRAKLIKADIRNKQEVAEKVKDMEFDVVVDFLSTLPSNLELSLSLFGDKCKQYIYISSATGYSMEARKGPIKEDAEFGNKMWEYGENKAQCERLLEEYCTGRGLNYTIVRPYVTYGDTRIPFGVISAGRKWSLAHRILKGKPVVMWDDGKAVCTLTHTIDFAVGIVGLFGNPKAENQAFHITSEEHLAWKDVLAMIASAVGKEATVVNIPSVYIGNEMAEYKGLLLGDKATNMIFDNSKIKEAVPAFDCKISFEEGIKKTIAYHRSHPEWMRVDYAWDARIDRLIAKYCKQNKLHNLDASRLKYVPTEKKCFRDWVVYETARRTPLVILLKLCREIRARLKG